MVFAMIVFTVAVIILSTVWAKSNSEFSVISGFGVGNMQQQLLGLEQRILTPGSPSNWNSFISVNSISQWDNISVGLGAGNSSIVSSQKVIELMAMSNTNYQATKQSMGVGYDYYITIFSPNQYNVSIGENPITNNAVAIQTAVIPVVLDNGVAGTMRISVWTNTTFGVS